MERDFLGLKEMRQCSEKYSIATTKSRADIGSPCLKIVVLLKKSSSVPFMLIEYQELSTQHIIHVMNLEEKPTCSRKSYKKSHLTESHAFLKSALMSILGEMLLLSDHGSAHDRGEHCLLGSPLDKASLSLQVNFKYSLFY